MTEIKKRESRSEVEICEGEGFGYSNLYTSIFFNIYETTHSNLLSVQLN